MPALDIGSASSLLIDLSNFDSVKQAAAQLSERKVDVLYNNAGINIKLGKQTEIICLLTGDFGLIPNQKHMRNSHIYKHYSAHV